MTATASPGLDGARTDPRPGPGRRRWRLDEYWPLTVYFYLFPLWWVLGLVHVIQFVLVVPMVWQLLAVRRIRVPQGFAAYALFLVWALASGTMLWVTVPGTESNDSATPLIGFAFRLLWYVTLAVVAVYVVNSDRARLTTTRLVRMMGFLFVVTVVGGYAGILLPNVDFPSVLELFLPRSLTQREFMNALFHPRIALVSDILGFSQPRITAPYSYPNTWGNAFGVLVPFFVLGWLGKGAGWRRYAAPVILVASVVPVVYSLNRGLWTGLAISFAWVVVRRLAAGDVKLPVLGILAATLGLLILSSTALGTTISLRIATPHSDERRQDTAQAVISATADNSPLLGYGSTRQPVGNFTSLAGGASPTCFQCAAPPLGTQGFMWGLIFMTGFVGAALFLLFMLWQVVVNARRPGPLALTTSTTLIAALFYFLVYDSLDTPLLVVFLGLAVSAREYAVPRAHEVGS